jgi:hypothetical protein
VDLPIDHFRLLGVSPSSDAQTVLRTLQQRLDRLPDDGFTAETLLGRAELLRTSADLLSDSERRAGYESDLTALAGADTSVVPALEIPSSREVPGLLLLLEAGQPLEAFELAWRSLQPPQAPALGSGREQDLTLLAGLACLAAADEAKQLRHFESAARSLQQGLQLLQRMGKAPVLRERMGRELEALSPYRVLDLLSRDLGASEERREGLALLEQLVQRRGGLEGGGDPDFGPNEFQAFFKQIRGFLTVQEQVDLFSRWGDEGSALADFLASTALTASGFARRKPERIAAARDRLMASGRPGIEPLLANLHLLLGEVDNARRQFADGAGKDLKAWAARQSEDPLAQLCAYCRDWLGRDVLPGYRDLDADPDLEAYFSDRDVISWVEQEDRRSGRHFPSPASSGAVISGGVISGAGAFNFDSSSWADGGFSDVATSSSGNTTPRATLSGALGTGFGVGFGSGFAHGFGSEEHKRDGEDDEAPLRWSLPQLRLPEGLAERLANWRLPALTLPERPAPWLATAAGGVGLIALAATWLLRPRPPALPTPPARGVVEIPVSPLPPPQRAATQPLATRLAPPSSTSPATQTPAPLTALTAAQPGAAQLRGQLEAWLRSKTQVLGGAPLPANLDTIAREGLIERLSGERQQDVAAGQTQNLDVSITDLSISESNPARIAVTATLRYSDSRRDASGKVVGTTPQTTLRNVYVFGRDGDRWRLAATTSAD